MSQKSYIWLNLLDLIEFPKIDAVLPLLTDVSATSSHISLFPLVYRHQGEQPSIAYKLTWGYKINPWKYLCALCCFSRTIPSAKLCSKNK